MRVHLHNATLTGSLNTTAGVVSFALYAHYTHLALLLSWSATTLGRLLARQLAEPARHGHGGHARAAGVQVRQRLAAGRAAH